MAYIIALLMASLSFLLNRFFMRTVGPVTVISIGPFAEEAAKTLLAYYMGTGIVAVHAIFGVIEAVYDWCQDGKSRQLLAPLLSIAGHALFGTVTAGILDFTGIIWFGLAAGTMVHLAYNVAVVRMLAEKGARNRGRRDKS
ncbi:hypothetical protein [Sporomusa aerivorans]|uniref:hypothetical protein n=1 Tax=Sporomusa aerivorans TaxID=204936 RepID=UPI00352ACD97